MMMKWAEDDRQAKIKAQQLHAKKMEYRELVRKLDLERHKQHVDSKVGLPFSLKRGSVQVA